MDPVAAARIHPTDQVRIERALEVHALTGRKLSELQREHSFNEARHAARVIHLEPPRDWLRQRIEERTRLLFAEGSGLWDEVKALPADSKALKIIGYGEARRALDTGDLAAACAATIARTWQYAKRQRTWFRKEYGEGVWPPPVLRP